MGRTTRKSHTQTHHTGQTYAVWRPTQDPGHRLAALALEPELEPSSSSRELTSRAGLDERLWASVGEAPPHALSTPEGREAVGEAVFVRGFDLRLWLWSVDILKYFLGMPSPKLPVGTSVFSKMKTPNKEVEPRCFRGPSGQGPGPSGQNGVVHRLRGVGLAGQLLQRPSIALVQHL